MQEPVSLYLELEPGQKVDLEIVAKAALAFDAAIKELAYVLDPAIEVRVAFASGTESSLSLNAIIKGIKRHATLDAATLKAVVIVVLTWFANDIRQYGVTETLNRLFKGEQSDRLSEADLKKIEEMVRRAVEGKVAQRQVREVYRELERDQSIRGVGATIKPSTRPKDIIPRDEFPVRSGVAIVEETAETRTRVSKERVVLISPVLLEGQRRWRFSFHEGEFGAPIKDVTFLHDLLTGRVPLAMVAGIEMVVLLQTKEQKVDGVWSIVERNILKVYSIHRGPEQDELRLPPSPDDSDNGNGEDG